MIVRTKQNNAHKIFAMTREEIASEIERLKAARGCLFPSNVTRFVAILDDNERPIIEPMAGRRIRFPHEN